MAVFTMPADEAEKKEGDLETCLAGIAAGEKAALARFYEQTYAAAYGLAVSILQNRQDAEAGRGPGCWRLCATRR